jgi:hypothetical protein
MAQSFFDRRHVGFWYQTDMPTPLTNVGYQGKSGSNSDIVKPTRLTQLRHEQNILLRRTGQQ